MKVWQKEWQVLQEERYKKFIKSYSVSKIDVETGEEDDKVTETVSVSKFLEVLRGKDH